MKMLMIRIAKASVSGFCLAFVAFACNRSANSNQDTAQVAQNGQTPNPNAPIMLRGTVTSVSANQLVLKSDTGAVTVTLTQPFHVYSRVPSDLSHVKEGSFIGVTTSLESLWASDNGSTNASHRPSGETRSCERSCSE